MSAIVCTAHTICVIDDVRGRLPALLWRRRQENGQPPVNDDGHMHIQ